MYASIISSLIAAVIFYFLHRFLREWYPSNEIITGWLKDATRVPDRVELLHNFLLIFMAWLFLGNFFYIFAVLIARASVLLEMSSDFLSRHRATYDVIARCIIIVLNLLSLFCFFAGVSIIWRVHRIRSILFKYEPEKKPDKS